MRKNKQSGFSLIEVIFAVSVIAIAVIGILSVMVVSVKHQKAARETDLASNAAREQIERVRGTTFASIAPTFGPPNDHFTVVGLNMNPPDVLNPAGAQGQITLNVITADLLEVVVVVDWPSEAGSQGRISMTTQIYDNTP